MFWEDSGERNWPLSVVPSLETLPRDLWPPRGTPAEGRGRVPLTTTLSGDAAGWAERAEPSSGPIGGPCRRAPRVWP